MLHPDQLAEVAHLRHEDDLKKAEAARLYKQFKVSRPGLFQRVNQLLSVIKQRVEAAQAPSQPVQTRVRNISDQFKAS